MKLDKFIQAGLLVFLIVILTGIEAKPPILITEYGEISKLKTDKKIVEESFSQPATLVNADDIHTSIIFVGDVLLARNVEVLMERYSPSYPYGGIEFNKLSFNPFVVGNFESTIPLVHKPTEALKMNFSTDSKYLKSASNAGFSIFSLANNHSYDSGNQGYLNTVDELLKNNLAPFGHPNKFDKNSVSFVEVNKKRIALIAIQAIEIEISDKEIDNVFEYANKYSDLQIVFVHWGVEYNSGHSPKQRQLAEKFVHAGADIVIGHHPHVVQDIDLIDGVPVFYSLGNYIFDQYFSDAVQQGLMLQLHLGSDSYIDLIPVTSIGSLSQPHIMDDAQHFKFLENIAKQSNPLLIKDIEVGIIPLNYQVATSSKVAMINK